MQLRKTVVAAITLAVAASGCFGAPKLIDKVVFEPSQDQTMVTLKLVFMPSVKTDISGSFPFKSYGEFFVNPYTPTEPFEIGLHLDTSIVNDQDVLHFAPTSTLPNGVPIGIPNVVVDIRRPQPVASNFDIYGYVDVVHGAWYGVAVVLGFVDNYFPESLSMSQTFKRDAQGNARVVADLYGPVLNDDGSVKTSGGLAVFANAKELLALSRGRSVTLTPDGGITLAGPAAPRYEGNPAALRALQSRILRGLNGEAR